MSVFVPLSVRTTFHPFKARTYFITPPYFKTSSDTKLSSYSVETAVLSS